jgi:hypothetical protein
MLAVYKWRDDRDAHVTRCAGIAGKQFAGETDFLRTFIDCITGNSLQKRDAGTSERPPGFNFEQAGMELLGNSRLPRLEQVLLSFRRIHDATLRRPAWIACWSLFGSSGANETQSHRLESFAASIRRRQAEMPEHSFWFGLTGLSNELRGECKAWQAVQDSDQNPKIGIHQKILIEDDAVVTHREEEEKGEPKD